MQRCASLLRNICAVCCLPDIVGITCTHNTSTDASTVFITLILYYKTTGLSVVFLTSYLDRQ